MEPSRFHLAQLNIGRMRGPIDDPVMEGFRSQLEAVNALADRSPGFVWRLQTEDGDATAIRAYDDPLMAVNMSVWESLDALHAYVYSGAHVGVLRDRKLWFDPAHDHILVLWWVPAGHVPTMDEAKGKLEALRAHGPSAAAFTFRKAFPPPGAEAIDAPEVDAEFCRG
ncbi:MAG: DUF3291 domain-containing protein [Vicinamibacteria bacterium]